MSEFDDGDGWAEVQVKKKVKAQAKAVLNKHEDELVAQENKKKLQEMKELYKDKAGTKKPVLNKEQEKRGPTTPVKKAKPEPKPVAASQKPKYKDIEHALRAINVADFHLTLESVRASFNANHLILLRAVTSYLNEHIRLTSDNQPTYSSKSNFYPGDVIPAAVRKDIVTVIRDAGPSNYQYFFDMCLSNMADDMNKGLRYLGYKVILQQIAKEEPVVCGNSLARSVMLRNSYQNKPQIGLTILWALGQGGFHNLSVGLKVWHDIMLPVLDSKHYAAFVGDYLHRILKNYSLNPYKVYITHDDFLTVYNLLTTTKKIPKPLVDKILLLYTEMYARNVTNPQKTFIQLLENIEDYKQSDYIRHCLLWCINRDVNCLTVWKLNFERLAGDSLGFLHYLDQNFKSLTTSVVKNVIFKEFLIEVSQLDALEGLEKDEDQDQGTTKAVIKQMQEKANKKNKGGKNANKSGGCSSCCKWTLGIFVLLGAIAGLLTYDTNIHGGKFEASATGKFLKDVGALPYVETAWTVSMKYSARGFVWAENNLPVYYSKTRVVLEPYVDMSKDLSIIAWNGAGKVWNNTKEMVSAKTPLVTDFIEQYAPGLPKKIADFTSTACGFVSTTTVNFYHSSCEFFKTKVLVGKLSPENLSKVMNSTQETAAIYYSSFHKNVEYYAKLK